MTNPLDITGTRVTPIVFTLSPEAVAELAAQEVKAPANGIIRILLREPTQRQKEQFELDRAEGGRIQLDFEAWLLDETQRRLEGEVDQRVLKEWRRDLSNTDVALLMQAYMSGVVPDPKAVQATAGLIHKTQNGIVTEFLATLVDGAPLPSLAISTDSNPGTSPDSPTTSSAHT